MQRLTSIDVLNTDPAVSCDSMIAIIFFGSARTAMELVDDFDSFVGFVDLDSFVWPLQENTGTICRQLPQMDSSSPVNLVAGDTNIVSSRTVNFLMDLLYPVINPKR